MSLLGENVRQELRLHNMQIWSCHDASALYKYYFKEQNKFVTLLVKPLHK